MKPIQPSHVTIYNRKLAKIAQTIAEQAPPSASEIILEGSVARGFADQFSDIELQFLSDHVPSVDDIIVWMKSIGFRGEAFVRLHEPDCILINDYYDGVRIELYWTSFDYEAEQLKNIMERIGGAQFINEAYKWSDAIPLRDGSHITNWKNLFNHYPDSVRNRYILPILDEWRISLTDPIETLGRWKDAYRQSWFYLLKTHWMDILPLLRIIFAYNRVWEPVAKWWHTTAPKLVIKPDNFIERINDVINNPNPVARIDQLSKLQLEILHLIKDEYPVLDLIERLAEIYDYGLKMAHRQLD